MAYSRLAAYFAFRPPRPSYSLVPDTQDEDQPKLQLNSSAHWYYSARILARIRMSLTATESGHRIVCMYVPFKSSRTRFTILFSHMNAADLGQMSSFYAMLGARIKCNVFSYDYSGYGASQGRPSERHMYADIAAAHHELLTRYSITPENTILYGQSIGTVATVELATRVRVAAVVLHSPVSSALRILFPRLRNPLPVFDCLSCTTRVHRIESPVLVIHGTADRLIAFQQAVDLYQRCPVVLRPLWLAGAGHNDVVAYEEYYERLERLVGVELVRDVGEYVNVLGGGVARELPGEVVQHPRRRSSYQ